MNYFIFYIINDNVKMFLREYHTHTCKVERCRKVKLMSEKV